MVTSYSAGFWISLNIPRTLPKLAEAVRTLPTEKQRRERAESAYEFYGTILAYAQDDNEVTFFTPSEEDKDALRKTESTNLQAKKITAVLERTTFQFPYLFALYASTYFSAFFIGGSWLVMKIPKDSVTLQS